jgi:hypothetical protein
MALNYSAVWRPGTGTQFWNIGISLQEFQQRDAEFFARGLRLVVLRRSGDRFAAVWRDGAGAQFWKTGLGPDEFKREDLNLFNQGFRLVTLHIEHDNYTAVWRPGTGAQFWHTGLSGSEFHAKAGEFWAQGLRLVTMMKGYNGDFDKFMGVWQPGTGVELWFSGLGSEFERFRAEDTRHLNDGLRLVAFPPYAINAIWHPGSGEQRVNFAVSLDAFKQADAEFFARGLRLVDLSEGASP